MKKKLTLMILTVLVLLIGKAEALTLTQKLGDEYIVTTVEQGDEVEMTFTSKVGFKFKNWVVTGASVANTSSETINFTINNQNVTVEGKYIDKYVVTFNANGGEGSMSNLNIPSLSSKNLTKNTFTKANHNFIGWAESENGDKKYDDQESITPTSDLNLYALWEEEEQGIPLTDIDVGDYVQYTPASDPIVVYGTDSGTGSDQTFDPTLYTKGWKVLYKDNTTGTLTLISAENVLTGQTTTSLTLGKSGSANFNETSDDLDGGKIGYAKAIYTLNKFCNDFATGDIAESGRCLGYNGSAPGNLLDKIDDLNNDGEKNVKDITRANIVKILGSTSGSDIILEPWGDNYNSTDITLVTASEYNLQASIKGGFWLASRCLEREGLSVDLYVRSLRYDLVVSGTDLSTCVTNGYSGGKATSLGVRPVITLKSDLKVTSGADCDGSTLEKAYVLEVK